MTTGAGETIHDAIVREVSSLFGEGSPQSQRGEHQSPRRMGRSDC
jgi:hypothetical protein